MRFPFTRRAFLFGSTVAGASGALARSRRLPREEIPTGPLVAFGWVALDQFWPTGESDGDTCHVQVDRFEFNGQETSAFEGATVAHRPVLRKGRITVRWQGIDCPELHFGRSIWYRQHWGQAPPVRLASFLRNNSGRRSEVEVQVTTRVRSPNDVFDKYGRFIGDVLVSGVNLNHWMLEQGWAFPSFYDSLQADEVLAYLRAAANATSPMLADYTTDLTRWQPELRSPRREVPDKAYDEREDAGPVQLPKLFRRIVSFRTEGESDASSLGDFIRSRSHSERVYLTQHFLELGRAARTHSLADFIDEDDQFTADPQALIFKEAPATLYGLDGRRVLAW
jgi:endonuclease YncB( thermonuclease family)